MQFRDLLLRKKRRLKRLRVLVLDDTNQVLSNLTEDISLGVEADGAEVKMHLTTVLIEATAEGFSRATIEKLINAIHDQEFDYIFSDYAFIADRKKNEDLKSALQNETDALQISRLYDEANKSGVFLTLLDLEREVSRSLSETNIQARWPGEVIRKKLLHHSGELFIYTNSPPPFNHRFEGSLKQQLVEEFKRVFRYAILRDDFIVDLHRSRPVKADAQDAWPEETQAAYKAGIVAANLDAILREEALKRIIHDRARMKFRRTDKVVNRLLLISIGIGAVGAVAAIFFVEVLKYADNSGMDPVPSLLVLVGWLMLAWLVTVILLRLLDHQYSSFIEDPD